MFNAIPAGPVGLPIPELQACNLLYTRRKVVLCSSLTAASIQKIVGAEVAKIGQGKAFKNKWIAKSDNNLVRSVDSVEDTTQKELLQLQENVALVSEPGLRELRKRKLCDKGQAVSFIDCFLNHKN